MYCRLAGIHSICAFMSYPMDIIHWLYLPFIWFSERSILKIQTHLQICHTFLSHLSFWFSGRSIWSGGAPPAEREIFGTANLISFLTHFGEFTHVFLVLEHIHNNQTFVDLYIFSYLCGLHIVHKNLLSFLTHFGGFTHGKCWAKQKRLVLSKFGRRTIAWVLLGDKTGESKGRVNRRSSPGQWTGWTKSAVPCF